MNRKNDIILGYEHPTSTNSSTERKYKTFTEGKKYKKKEEFGYTTVGKNYATAEKIEAEKCPVCKDIAISTCPCGYSDKTCSSGHKWYTDRVGETKVGNPHK